MKTLLTFMVAALPVWGFASELPSGFLWMRELVGGDWEGRFPDGKTIHRQTYTIQYGYFLRGAATLTGVHQGRDTEGFAGDSVFAWDPGTSNVVYYIWGSDGYHSREVAHFEGDRIVFPVHSRKEPGKLRYRSVWTRLDADSFRVDREVPSGEGWKVALSVIYYRKRNVEPGGPANGSPPIHPETNRTSSAAGSRR